MPSSAREEAERLVAAVMAMADTAGLGGFAHSVRDAVGRVAGERPPTDSGERPPTDSGERSPTDSGERPPTDSGERSPTDSGERPSTASGEPAVADEPTASDKSGADRPGSADKSGAVGAAKGQPTAGSWRGPTAVGAHKPGSGWATGSAECCVCPVCQAIAAARNPSPATAVRIATGAGDVATGLAGLLRGLSRLAGDRPSRAAKPATPRPAPSPDEAWSTATRRADPS